MYFCSLPLNSPNEFSQKARDHLEQRKYPQRNGRQEQLLYVGINVYCYTEKAATLSPSCVPEYRSVLRVTTLQEERENTNWQYAIVTVKSLLNRSKCFH